MACHSNCLPQFSRVFKETLGKTKSQCGGNKVKSSQRQYSALPEELCRQFSLSEIKAATNNFHEDMIIGHGTYEGPMYRGVIDGGTLPVAVKCFYNFLQSQEMVIGGGIREFRTEVQFLCHLCHPNLVTLIGFCDERNKMILLYEHSGRGTLYNHLYGTDVVPLPWKQRLEICIGAARGLHYLHTGAKRAVIHRNINSRNILLDHERVHKLSEFGYSMMGPLSMSNALIKIEKGYTGFVNAGLCIDPEELKGKPVSDKSNVYSFGVVLFEVLFRSPGIYEIIKCIQQGTNHEIIDPYLKGTIAQESFTKFIQIAFSCLGKEGNERPAMGEVEVMLEHALELQKKADSEMKYTNPHAAAYVHGEVSSFQSSVYGGNISESYSYSSDTCSVGGYLSDSHSSLGR